MALAIFVHARRIAPVFAAAALLFPGLLATISAGWTRGALLSAGLSIGLTAALLALYRWRVTRVALHGAVLALPVELFYRIVYRGALSPGTLLSVADTNLQETSELLTGHPSLSIVLLVLVLATLAFAAASWRARNPFTSARCTTAFAAAILLVGTSSAAAIISWRRTGQHVNRADMTDFLKSGLQRTFPADLGYSLLIVITGLIDTHRQADRRAAFLFPKVRRVAAYGNAPIRETYVVVIGEASRRANWSLYGYQLPTTPRLESLRSELFVFDRMTSNATITALSLPLALTRATPATWGVAQSERSIISLLRQAGFSVSWISNQERLGRNANPISAIALEANSASFAENGRAGSSEDRLDSNLILRLRAELAHSSENAKSVVFVHLMGSHFEYRERYPPSFGKFDGVTSAGGALTDRQQRVVNQYNDSVYFTDYVLRSEISQLAALDGISALLFFSDHGERLFDSGADNDLGHGFPSVSRQEIEIPFFIWLSDGYKARNPGSAAALAEHTHSAGELHNLFETIVDMAGIDYDGRSGSLSLFSNHYEPTREFHVLDTRQRALSIDDTRLPSGGSVSD